MVLNLFFQIITSLWCFCFYRNSFFLGSSVISLNLIIDWISIRFSCVVCLISACVMLFSSSYMSHDSFLRRFRWLVILFVVSINLLIFIPTLPALLIGWDGLGIVSFALVIYYQNVKSLNAGILTIIANRIGDVMILVSIRLLILEGHWVATSLWDFEHIFRLGLLIMVAGLTKRAQIPFSRWLPAAIAAPTPVSALVHSSTLVTAGVFILVRFHFPLLSSPEITQVLTFLAVITLVIAGIGANFENDLKKIIALSTLRQLGIIILRLRLKQINLTLFHLYVHALFKALLFLCAGMFIHNLNNNQDIRRIGSLFHQFPTTTMCINIANLSLCGIPFIAGFFSKDAILEFSLQSSLNLILILIVFISTGLTAAYSIRLVLCTICREDKGNTYHRKSDTDYYVFFSILTLRLAAITRGFALQELNLLFYPGVFFLTSMQKILTLIRILLGGAIALFMWPDIIHLGRLTSFFSSLWF